MTTTVQQRQRTKGWRKPEGSVCVDRTSRWGNPFAIGSNIPPTLFVHDGFVVLWTTPRADCADDEARHVAVEYFRSWLAGTKAVYGQDDRRQWILDHVHELRGKTLLCWCPQPGPCHAHVLADMADNIADTAPSSATRPGLVATGAGQPREPRQGPHDARADHAAEGTLPAPDDHPTEQEDA